MNGQDAATCGSTFGELLRRHRLARALTQEGLAEGARVSARAISDLERGARTFPYRETAILLADALQLAGHDRDMFLAAARRRRSLDRVADRSQRETMLPHPLSRLIGRSVEHNELVQLLRERRTRLLTLTGPAGVGKTRLALAAAASLDEAFGDGVVFVDLAPIRHPDHVLPAIATALGLSDLGEISLAEVLRRWLSSRQLLLVLDNFEHLLPAAPQVSMLLQAAPTVQALVTSRAVLRLHGECDYPVVPLPVPDKGTELPLETLAECAAIDLFVERAAAAKPGFRLTVDNAAAMAAICRQLDGLPLAIELAAARCVLLTPDTLLARLEQRFALLTAGRRDAPPRQQTLEAAIAWSYDLLAAEEQALLRSLAVCADGWTLEAAEVLGTETDIVDVLSTLSSLVEQSLVIQNDGEPGTAPRFRMLESIRAYAETQLHAAGEGTKARIAYLHYLVRLARENDLERLDARVGLRLAHLQAEDTNLRMGIGWAIEHDPATALTLLAELDFYWFLADRPTAGRELIARALATDADPHERARARVLEQATWFASIFGDTTQAEQYVVAAQVLAQSLGDEQTLARLQMCLGTIASSRGDAAGGQRHFAAALHRFESLADVWGICLCLTELGVTALLAGDAAIAVACFERQGAITEAQDLPAFYRAHSLTNLACAYNQQGRQVEAMAAGVAALDWAIQSSSPRHIAGAYITLGRLLLDHGKMEDAVALGPRLGESLGAYWEIGDRWSLVEALELVAEILAGRHHAELAARLLGAAASLREELPRPVGAAERPMLNALTAQIAAILGVPIFNTVSTTGARQPLATIVAEAQTTLVATANADGAAEAT